MEKLRVLFLITDVGKGGAERFLIDFATELIKHNDIEFVIASLFNSDDYAHLTGDLPIVQLDYKVYSLWKKNECPLYKKLLEEFKPHIVHTHRFLAEFLSSYYISENIKYVCHCHDNMIQLKKLTWKTFLNKRLFLDFLERRHLIRAKYRKVTTHFIANSEHTLNYYYNTLPKKSKHLVHLIPYGFNYNRFYKAFSSEIQESDPLKIINIGSFQEKKNQKFIVDIALELQKENFNFEIHLLGNGLLRSYVEELVRRNHLTEKIIFHGNVSKVEELLWESHIYLHTAWYEPFGLVFLEAMAAGLPVVCLDGKGNRDLIRQGKNGFLFYKEDAKVFAGAILNLVADKKLYHSISEYGKEYARQFDIQLKTQEFVGFYKSIL